MKFEDLELLACALPERILNLRYAGLYRQEIEAIDRMLVQPNVPQVLRRRLEIEREAAKRLPLEYTISYEEALARFRMCSQGFTQEDLDTMIADGRADWRFRDGKLYFHEDFIDSAHINAPALIYRDESLPRAQDLPVIDRMMEKGKLTLRHHIRHSVEILDRQPGKRILVHLPMPQQTRSQSNIVVHGSTPGAYISDALQRTISWDVIYEEGMEFYVEYSLDVSQEWNRPDPALVSPCQPDDYTHEEYPHIRFTPYLRALCAEIVGEETNALRKARLIYDYITKQVWYAYMRNYLLFDNVAEFAALNQRGDCGVQALLFITLCRIAGIGARWESGMTVHPDRLTSHDWASYYVAPFGWLYADLSRGGSRWQEKSPEKHDFFATSIDPMRITANLAFQKEFDPPKRFVRIDPFDNQLAEVEYEDQALTLSQFKCRRQVIGTQEI